MSVSEPAETSAKIVLRMDFPLFFRMEPSFPHKVRRTPIVNALPPTSPRPRVLFRIARENAARPCDATQFAARNLTRSNHRQFEATALEMRGLFAELSCEAKFLPPS